MNFKIQRDDSNFNIQSTETTKKTSKAEAKTKLDSAGTSEVSRPGIVGKSKEAASVVMGGLKRFLGKSSKATDHSIAKTVGDSLNVGKPVSVVPPARMAEAGRKMEVGLEELKAAEGDLKAAETKQKGLSKSLQDSIEGGQSTGQTRVALAENEFKIAQLQEKVNAQRCELAKEAKILLKSSSAMESAQAAEVLSENNLSTLEPKSGDLKLNTEVAKLKLELIKAHVEGKSEGTKELLKAQLGVAQAKQTKDEAIIYRAEEKLENLSASAKLEAEIDRLGNSITRGEKLILQAQLAHKRALEKAEGNESDPAVKSAAKEVESCRITNEISTTEQVYLNGLRDLDQIVSDALIKNPGLRSFSADLKAHLGEVEKFNARIGSAMNEEGVHASQRVIQLYDEKLMQGYAQTISPLIVKFEENSALLNKIDLEQVYPNNPGAASRSGKPSIGSLAILPVQRMPRHQMLVGEVTKRASPQNEERLTELGDAIKVATLKINKDKRIAGYEKSISNAEREVAKAKETGKKKEIELAEKKLAVAKLEVDVDKAANETEVAPRFKMIMDAKLALAKAEVAGNEKEIKEAKAKLEALQK